ncbi:hypothetical protein V490_00594 [Pseudogymnoascus sp. VKM F-3557]|nr:hypothetical protein V490_00594 [Pseudogymnoascus sp. VKM F-3557]
MYDETFTLIPPILRPNPDISGIGVLIGFVGIAYVTFILLALQYLIGKSSDTNLDGSTNPIDRGFLAFFWGTLKFLWGLPRKWAPLEKLLPPLSKPSERFAIPLKDAILAMSDAQIVTGISILAGGFSQLNCGLSIFHWHMVVRLAWFSSVKHLTTLTFLRRYIHDNHAVRMLRLVLMLALTLMLAVALIPTGGDCGLQSYRPDYLQPGSYGTVFKLFRSSSDFVKRWLRHKPAQMCKHVARKLEERYNDSYMKSTRIMYIICHCAVMAFITFARAIYDCVDSLLFEIFWLLFSLAWGTVRIFGDREIASMDFAKIPLDQEYTYEDLRTGLINNTQDFVLEENAWGFGQLIPTLLLILPLFSLMEGAIGIFKSKSTDPTEDYMAVAINESPLSHTQPKEELPISLQLYTGPYDEIDITTTVDLAKSQGARTDFDNMENGLPTEHLLQPSTEPRLRSSIHRRSIKIFYKWVYGFGILTMVFLFSTLGAIILVMEGNEDLLIGRLFQTGEYQY